MSPSNVSAYANLLQFMGAPTLLEIQKHRCEPKYNKLQHIIDSYRGNSGEYLNAFDEINYKNISVFLTRLEEKEKELILSEKKDVQAKREKREWMKKARKLKDPKLDWAEWGKIKDLEWKELKFVFDEKDTVKMWNDFREEYYREHGIDLIHISDLAVNYMKCWCCIWQLMMKGFVEWKGWYCLKFAPLIFDMIQSNSESCWEKRAGLHLTALAHMILVLPPKCIDALPEQYRPIVQKLYGEMENVENEIEIDFILERMKEDHLPTTVTVEEKALFFPCLDGDLPESVIRSYSI